MICKILLVLLFGSFYVKSIPISTLPKWTGCQQLIIDTDGGADDAVAILNFLLAHKMEYGPPIRAITLTYGISSVNQAAINVGKVLEVAGYSNIPFYIGASQPLVPPTKVAEPIYGTDALGDIEFNRTIPSPVGVPGIASHMLVSLVNELGDNAIVLALGPLTNLAMAHKIDKDFFNKLKRLEIAAGSVRGAGDVLPGREFNIYQDPYAFKVVLVNTHYTQASLYPLELASDHVITSDFWASLPATEGNYRIFITDILAFFSSAHPTSVLLSQVAVYASVLFPGLMVTSKEAFRVDCILSKEGRGILVVDYANKFVDTETSNFFIAQSIDIEAFKRISELMAME